jgi:hypothetical protein
MAKYLMDGGIYAEGVELIECHRRVAPHVCQMPCNRKNDDLTSMAAASMLHACAPFPPPR